MRLGFLTLFLSAGCASPAVPPDPLTADSFAGMFIGSYVTPTPATILQELALPMRAGDRVIANCAQAYAYTLPEMTIEEQTEFNANVTCVYPPQDEFHESFAHYAGLLRERGFRDESGTYVQSGMFVACNQASTVMIAIQSDLVPSFIVDPASGDLIDVAGGGELVNKSLAFTVSDRPCASAG